MGSDTVTQLIYNICSYLSGNIAMAMGVLVVIWSGYELLQGEVDKKKFVIRCIGVAVIIGGTFITKTYLLMGI